MNLRSVVFCIAYRAPATHDRELHLVSLIHVRGGCTSHTEDFVIGMGGHDEDPHAAPRRVGADRKRGAELRNAAAASKPLIEPLSSRSTWRSRKDPSPVATFGQPSESRVIVPGRSFEGDSTAAAFQII